VHRDWDEKSVEVGCITNMGASIKVTEMMTLLGHPSNKHQDQQNLQHIQHQNISFKNCRVFTSRGHCASLVWGEDGF
jgi:hypothetical protein